LAQFSETRDLETFAEASGHPYWDTTMNEEYRYLIDAGASQAAIQASMKAEDSWKVQHTFYMFWKCF
jgi:hypothetical protein